MIRIQRVLFKALLALWLAANYGLAFQGTRPQAKSKSTAASARETVLVVVNGQKITEADLARFFMTRKVPEEMRDKARERVLEDLIDTRLIQQFLASRDTKATKQELDAQVNRIRDAAKQRGSDPDKALAELGYTLETLRDEFAIPIAWQHHVDRVISQARLKAYFVEHRAEFDGTKVRSSQILIKVPAGDEEAGNAAFARMTALRKQIVEGKISFEDAARNNSDAPSREQGGDVGEFPFVGKMPEQLSREAFRLKVGEVGQPFTSKFGVHLIMATERKPGDLSLEDVRDDVLVRMSQEMWKKTAAEMRKEAKVEWKVEKPATRSGQNVE
jgi:foldase protein PrsA